MSNRAPNVGLMADATVATDTKSVDWAELRSLYVKGVSLSDLSKQFSISYSAIRNKSSRERWRDSVAKANTLVAQAATDHLQASVGSWITKIDKAVHAGLDNVLAKGLESMGLRELNLALDCAEKANRIARQTYGLDKQEIGKPASLTINVNTGGQLAVPLGQVIDAELVSEPGSDASNLPAQLTDAPPADEPPTQATKRKRVR
jgi:hypothetical protein